MKPTKAQIPSQAHHTLIFFAPTNSPKSRHLQRAVTRSFCSKNMAFGPSNKDEVHTDVLLQARQACYKARDEFYACVEKQSNKKPTEIAHAGLLYPADCKKSRAEFVENCRASWVRHFDRLYSKERKVRHLDDKDSRKGPLLLPQPSTFNYKPSD